MSPQDDRPGSHDTVKWFRTMYRQTGPGFDTSIRPPFATCYYPCKLNIAHWFTVRVAINLVTRCVWLCLACVYFMPAFNVCNLRKIPKAGWDLTGVRQFDEVKHPEKTDHCSRCRLPRPWPSYYVSTAIPDRIQTRSRLSPPARRILALKTNSLTEITFHCITRDHELR